MMRLRFLPIVAILVGIAALGVTPSADAAFRIRVENAGTGQGVVITDNNPGDIDPGAGSIVTATFNLGVFKVTVSSGFFNEPGVGSFAETDLSVVVNATGAGTLRVWLERDGFVTPSGAQPLVLNADVGGTKPSNATATFQTWVNAGNAIPALGDSDGGTAGEQDFFPSGALPGVVGDPPAGSVGAWPGTFPGVTFPTGAGFTSFSDSASVGWNKTGAYSLFSKGELVFGTGGGLASYDLKSSVTPVPATMLMVFSGVPVLGLVGYVRRRKTQSQKTPSAA